MLGYKPHQNAYDVILWQTFFVAIKSHFRTKNVLYCRRIWKPISGVLLGQAPSLLAEHSVKERNVTKLARVIKQSNFTLLGNLKNCVTLLLMNILLTSSLISSSSHCRPFVDVMHFRLVDSLLQLWLTTRFKSQLLDSYASGKMHAGVSLPFKKVNCLACSVCCLAGWQRTVKRSYAWLTLRRTLG